MAEHGITPSQTVGPFFHFSLTPTDYDFRGIVGDDLITPDAVGEHIRITRPRSSTVPATRFRTR